MADVVEEAWKIKVESHLGELAREYSVFGEGGRAEEEQGSLGTRRSMRLGGDSVVFR